MDIKKVDIVAVIKSLAKHYNNLNRIGTFTNIIVEYDQRGLAKGSKEIQVLYKLLVREIADHNSNIDRNETRIQNLSPGKISKSLLTKFISKSKLIRFIEENEFESDRVFNMPNGHYEKTIYKAYLKHMEL